MSLVKPPWTKEQVESLDRWQNDPHCHPFTCGNRDTGHGMDPEGDVGVLVATQIGWFCRWCDYTQDWAHDFMLTHTCPLCNR